MPSTSQPNPNNTGEGRSRDSRLLWLIGGVLAVVLLLTLGVAGTGTWLVLREMRHAAAERAEQEAAEEQRRAAKEQQRVADEQQRAAAASQAIADKSPPPNPYKPGTQTKLREVRAVELPEGIAQPTTKDSRPGKPNTEANYLKVVHSPRHHLLFALSRKNVWVFDLKAGKAVGVQFAKANTGFHDMGLTPDQSTLFVADMGSDFKSSASPSRVHRFDLTTREWKDRLVSVVAKRVEAVDAGRLLLLGGSQRPALSLCGWDDNTANVQVYQGVECRYQGDIEYDPLTGRVYHGYSFKIIAVGTVEGKTFKYVEEIAWEPSYNLYTRTVLSVDRSRLYTGTVSVSPTDFRKTFATSPDRIIAASRDIAFGPNAYYRVTTGSTLGEYGFTTTTVNPYQMPSTPPVVTVSPDGMSVWVLDRDKNVVRQFALEGDAGP